MQNDLPKDIHLGSGSGGTGTTTLLLASSSHALPYSFLMAHHFAAMVYAFVSDRSHAFARLIPAALRRVQSLVWHSRAAAQSELKLRRLGI